MEGFAQLLNDSANDGSLSVTVDGMEVLAVADSVTADGQLACNAGEGSYYFFCSEFGFDICPYIYAILICLIILR